MKNLRTILLLTALWAVTAWGGQDAPPTALPYSCDFSSAQQFADEWETINNNGDYICWEFVNWMTGPDGKPGCAYCATNAALGNDDYLVSQPLALEAGENHVTFSARGVRSDGLERIELYLGTSSDISQMTLIKKWTVTGDRWKDKAATFNVPAGGSYRIVLKSTSVEGYSTYVDNITVDKGAATISPELTVSSIVTPYSQCDYSAETPVGVTITNDGTADATQFTLAYSINGKATAGETFIRTIMPDSTATVYLTARADMEAVGKYDIEVTLTCDGKTASAATTVNHNDIVTQLPLNYNFATGIGNSWTGHNAGSWTYDQFGSCQTTTAHGIDNGLFSPCISLDGPIRMQIAYSGGMFGDNTSMKIILGRSGSDITTWRTIYSDDNVDRNGTEKEFTVTGIEPGLYSFAVINTTEATDIPLNIYHININGLYDYDLRAGELRSALTPYMPAEQYNSEGKYAMTIENRGTETVNSVEMSMRNDDNTYFNEHKDISLKPGESTQVTMTGSMPQAVAGDVIRGTYISIDTEGEKYAADNRIDIADITLTDTVFATENITSFISGTGVMGERAKFGNVYTLNTCDTLTSVSIGLAKDDYYVKRDIGIAVYEVEDNGHRIGRKLFHTSFERGADGRLMTIAFPPRLLKAGNYYVEAEQITPDNIGIANDMTAAGTTFYQSDGDSLYSINGVGAIALRMNFGHNATLHNTDAALTGFTSPIKEHGLLGRNDSIGVRVTNIGTDTIRTMRLSCAVDGTEKGETTIAMLPYEDKEIMFYGIDMSAVGQHVITVTATLDGDENPADNIIERTVTCVEEASPYRLDFEQCDDFDCGTMFNPRWRTVDRNGRGTNAWSFYDYPHKEEPVGFIAFNTEATTPPITDIPGFYPHDGKRFGAAFCTEYSMEPVASDVWLISPQLQLGNNSSIRLYVKTNELSYYNKPERYRILVSDTDDNFDSFTIIGGEREAAADDWEEVNVDISEYDNKPVYVALQYVSLNNEGSVMMVDDIEIQTGATAVNNVRTGAGDIKISRGAKQINISASSEIVSVRVYSTSGQIVYSADNIGSNSHRVSTEAMTDGVYIVKAQTAKDENVVKITL